MFDKTAYDEPVNEYTADVDERPAPRVGGWVARRAEGLPVFATHQSALAYEPERPIPWCTFCGGEGHGASAHDR